MQYIPGKALDKIISEGPANLQLLLSAGIQIADGLTAAHALGIFHRDLKPANVMLRAAAAVTVGEHVTALEAERGVGFYGLHRYGPHGHEIVLKS